MLVISGNSDIKSSIIMSNSTLDGGDGTGSFGNVMVLGVPQADGSFTDLSVQLAGTFQKLVLVASQATVTAMSGAIVNEIGVAAANKNDQVTLQGTINNVDVFQVGKLEISDGSAINTITVYANTHIIVDKTAAVGGITKENNAMVTLDGDGA
ncbi:hypothetical protein [Desulfitobacterium sp. AusDCA]|uniref:hypothetical protein n=1 Tax=Desulfitobacterium sp. AusDCA TaxID=3240383 RepID=UPI003DA7293D